MRARSALTPDHPAYMIYTSGSTGMPKGIVITGRNICHYLRSANEIYGITPHDVVFQGASVAFDLSMEEIWIPYLVGATLFVATPEIMGEADKLPDILDDAGVTVLDTVPTLLAMMPKRRAEAAHHHARRRGLPALGRRALVRPGRTIFNSYGPTEATVVATVCGSAAGRARHDRRPDPELHLLRRRRRARTCSTAGIEGELLIGGPGVARGYLKRDELTAEKFIANPFCVGRRDPILYRSGDAVVIDEDGNIGFRGRIDDQVKIRGFRVELGEIEAKLDELPGVSQAAVVLRDDRRASTNSSPSSSRTRAPTLDPKQMRADLRATLPAYMVPGRYEMLDTLPTLPSGKVNRNLLKQRRTDRRRADRGAGGRRAPKPRPRCWRPPSACCRRSRFRSTPISSPTSAAIRCSPRASSPSCARFRGSPASRCRTSTRTRTLRAHGRASRRQGGGRRPRRSDLSFTPPPLLRRFLCGLGQAVAAALHPRLDDGAMARRVRQLHAADRAGRQPV